MAGVDVDAPIIILSVGRSGSTFLHEILSLHPDAAWLTALAAHHPDHPGLQRAFLRAAGFPLLGRALRRRWAPIEAYEYFERFAKGFMAPCRNLRADDVTPRVQRDLQRALGAIRTRRRRRLLVKITGWPRATYLREIFPDARFVHLVRDGRAVTNSVIQTPWWWGWRGPTAWRFGELTAQDREIWEEHDRSFVVLAALQWRFVVRAIEEDLTRIPSDRVRALRYEDLCARPTAMCRDLASFCGLPWNRAFARAVTRQPVRPTNGKFSRDLSAAQVRDIEDVLGPLLTRYGYA